MGVSDCIGIMTDVALTRSWFLYELAFLKARLARVPILTFGPTPPEGHPLSALQIRDGCKIGTVNDVVMQMIEEEDQETRQLLSDRILSKDRDWKQVVDRIAATHVSTQPLRRAATTVNAIFNEYSLYKGLAEHSCMRELTVKMLEDLAGTLRPSVESSHRDLRMDKRRYPEYLCHLQEKLKPRTLAIAVIEDLEEFWAQKTGSDILQTTQPESERIFVFGNQGVFDRYIRHVLLHAEKYRVFAISASEFGKCQGARARGDFSVITDNRTGDRVTAYYDSAAANIHFTTDPITVRRNLAIFEGVLMRAHPVRSVDVDGEYDTYAKELRDLVFTPGADAGQYHSDAVPIQLYDTYEEQHPFYQEMHQRMLCEFRGRVESKDQVLRILEIGAGTGHFTKKLIQQQYPNMTIKAMEPDPAAQEILDRKLKHKSYIAQSIRASALHYEPRGEFRFIFSSFSEHHICPEDKEHYFAVIAGALEPGGHLIVGDEFLPPHKHDDPAAYDAALQKYHNYIIDLARSEHLYEVANLETLALASGSIDAHPRVDYKITIDRYKGFAEKGGLVLESEFCISPEDRCREIGGVHVLVFQKPKRNEAIPPQ